MDTQENNQGQNGDEKYNEGISYGGVNSNDTTPNNTISDSDDAPERLSDYPAGNETDDDKNQDATGDSEDQDFDDEDFEKDPEHPGTDPSKLDQL